MDINWFSWDEVNHQIASLIQQFFLVPWVISLPGTGTLEVWSLEVHPQHPLRNVGIQELSNISVS